MRLRAFALIFVASLFWIGDGGSTILDLNGVMHSPESFKGATTYPVYKVVAGDTIKIQYEGKIETVRLIGVDTPETVHSNQSVEFYGKEASAFVKNLLIGESVFLRFGNEERGKYDRLLAYVYRAPDGMFIKTKNW